MLTNSESVCTICSGGELPQFLRGILGNTQGMTFMTQAAETIGTLSKTTPSTGRGGQFFQLTGFSSGNTYQLKELATHHVEGVVLLKVSD